MKIVILLGPVVTDNHCRGLQRQPFESADGGHQGITTAFAIACQVAVRFKRITTSQINANADVLKCFELPHASTDRFFPQAVVKEITQPYVKKKATNRQVVAFGSSCNRKNEFLKRSRAGAREGICRIRNEVCFIVYLTARSQQTQVYDHCNWSCSRRVIREPTAVVAAFVCRSIPMVGGFIVEVLLGLGRISESEKSTRSRRRSHE